MSLGVFWPQAESDLIGSDSFLQASGCRQGDAPVHVQFRVQRPQPQRLVKIRQRFIKAPQIGARQADIVRQFLTEAVLISIIGGLIGIAFGYSLANIIAAAAGWPTDVTTTSIVVAFGVSVGIGLLFGIYPAVQAAKLDPIEAIRYE